MLSMLRTMFSANPDRYDGVPPANIWLMRAVFLLMALFLGKDTWTHIFGHTGSWAPQDAMVWSVWAAFASLAAIGVFRTVSMIPLLVFEVFYKLLWLALVAYPLWVSDRLAGSPAEGMTNAFLWVVLPLIAVPWPYVFRTYLLGKKAPSRKF